MDYYNSAVSWLESAKLLESNGYYQQSVSQSCLSAELFLKSRLSIIDPNSELDKSYDSINIFNELKKKYPTNKDLLPGIRLCRKYFTEARYPYDGTGIYTKEFAQSFIGYVEQVKDYIDDDCQPTLDDLQRKFNKDIES